MPTVIQDSGQSAYLTSLAIPIAISTMTQLSQWSFQQQLTYNAVLPYICKDFMGLQDTYDQFNIYSQTNAILQNAWNTIKSTVKLNLNVNKEMYIDPALGQVGDLFSTIPSYALVFTTNSAAVSTGE